MSLADHCERGETFRKRETKVSNNEVAEHFIAQRGGEQRKVSIRERNSGGEGTGLDGIQQDGMRHSFVGLGESTVDGWQPSISAHVAQVVHCLGYVGSVAVGERLLVSRQLGVVGLGDRVLEVQDALSETSIRELGSSDSEARQQEGSAGARSSVPNVGSVRDLRSRWRQLQRD